MVGLALSGFWGLLAFMCGYDAWRRGGEAPVRLASGLAYGLWLEALATWIGAYTYPAQWTLGGLAWPTVLLWALLLYMAGDDDLTVRLRGILRETTLVLAILLVVAVTLEPLGLIAWTGSGVGWSGHPGLAQLWRLAGVPLPLLGYWFMATLCYAAVRRVCRGRPAQFMVAPVAGLILLLALGALRHTGAVGWIGLSVVASGATLFGLTELLLRRSRLDRPASIALALTLAGGALLTYLLAGMTAGVLPALIGVGTILLTLHASDR